MGPARLAAAAIAVLLFAATAARADTLAEAFAPSDEAATEAIDHSVWNRIVGTYLRQGDKGLAVFDYAAVSKDDRAALKDYVAALEQVTVTAHARDAQMAYWINLYNALTVDVILDHYPVASIRDIKSGLFSSGPWSGELVMVEGHQLSLDDIEHEILRPIWGDKRIHYAVNCASVGCPNLAPEAYTSDNLERLLEKGAHDYINSPRGVRFEEGRLIASNIYSWYADDFGTEEDLLAHFRKYAETDLQARLEGVREIYDYDYDWTLNAPQ